ncbi:arylsulfatase-activating protein [Cupriavidus taiwanensis]|uniref:anaerobic sulfatase maturase n=1 Tax=Cupriavidus taiwanensis TaxID=164546 RepID=UPI000E188D47|nr:anaerobic sulfatase maturase [Cupriavidus taiwanensis]SOZ32851.1 arylsulfatase-activating protein [Cupriavidus taiwanensis]
MTTAPPRLPSHPHQSGPFHAMTKPSGSDCNLDCAYCFYLEKAALYEPGPGPGQRKRRMPDDVLAAYVRNYIASHPPGAEVIFTWQGGEPTLLGLDFYHRAVHLQQQLHAGRSIRNSFQTNGLLLDDEWCAFFASHDFLVGLSLDGPADIHDAYRVSAGGQPTHALVMSALATLQAHRVRHNVLACVNRRSAAEPLRTYEFLRAHGVRHIQFIPVVERRPGAADSAIGLTLHGPGGKVLAQALPGAAGSVTEWSVPSGGYGDFLNAIFDVWVRRDVGTVHVMNFEWALANYMGEPGAACHHQPTCGRAVVVEHNGDVYACDHYVYPAYRLGNLGTASLAQMVDSPAQHAFGQDKLRSLPRQCVGCKVLKGCWGGCPKHRFTTTRDGEPGPNYLCDGYYRFFGHVAPYLRTMSELIRAGRPASDVTRAVVLRAPATP